MVSEHRVAHPLTRSVCRKPHAIYITVDLRAGCKARVSDPLGRWGVDLTNPQAPDKLSRALSSSVRYTEEVLAARKVHGELSSAQLEEYYTQPELNVSSLKPPML